MAASKSPRKYLILAKTEVTQFTDPVPVQATNAMLVKNLKATPLKVTSEDRALMRPYYGNSEQLPVSEEAQVDFDIELAGSGTAGSAPKWAPLLRACGWAETLVAVTSATYNPISSAQESVTIYCYRDGLLYQLSGARGTVKITMGAKKIPHLNFSFIGKYVPVTDVALPSAPDYTGFQTPKASIPAWTGALTLGGYAAQTSAFNFDLANVISHAIWMNADSLDITDRKPKGSITVQAPTIAAKDYFALIRTAALSAFSLVHGTVPGNIVTMAAPKTQLVDVAEAEYENAMAYTFNTTFNPNTGNDEFTIACT